MATTADEYDAIVRTLNAERHRRIEPDRKRDSLSLLAELIAQIDLATRMPPMNPPDPLIRAELKARGIPCD